jgi:hypothetical protein
LSTRPGAHGRGVWRRLGRLFGRRFEPQLADLFKLALQGEFAQVFDRQTDEDRNALIEHPEAVVEGEAALSSLPVALAGSGWPQCVLIGWPGLGQTSFAASSQTVKTKSSGGASCVANSSQFLERSGES